MWGLLYFRSKDRWSPIRRINIVAVLIASLLAIAINPTPASAAALAAGHHRFPHHHECHTVKCAHEGDKKYNKHRRAQLERREREELAQGWAIPWYIVNCESKGKNLPPHEYAPGIDPSGYYQIIGSTWRAYGGGIYASEAWQATKVQQGRIARKIVAESPKGIGEWECA